ncbi:MAG: flavin reductase family protein [Candidatus Nezhaarchaeota archaeon]|nr:flavin reductase family protein [Candidatus Nezhaarchaeota archaeon]
MKTLGLSEAYKLLHPKLTVLIAAYTDDGRPNAMACSWITPASEEPPLVAAFISKGSFTAQLIEKRRAFTVNVPAQEMLRAVWIAGTRSGRRGDKLKAMGVSARPARRVEAPIIERCAAYLECRLHSSFDAGECYCFLGEVLEAYVDEALFEEVWSIEKAKLLLHLGGSLFTTPSGLVRAK